MLWYILPQPVTMSSDQIPCLPAICYIPSADHIKRHQHGLVGIYSFWYWVWICERRSVSWCRAFCSPNAEFSLLHFGTIIKISINAWMYFLISFLISWQWTGTLTKTHPHWRQGHVFTVWSILWLPMAWIRQGHVNNDQVIELGLLVTTWFYSSLGLYPVRNSMIDTTVMACPVWYLIQHMYLCFQKISS